MPKKCHQFVTGFMQALDTIFALLQCGFDSINLTMKPGVASTHMKQTAYLFFEISCNVHLYLCKEPEGKHRNLINHQRRVSGLLLNLLQCAPNKVNALSINKNVLPWLTLWLRL